MRFLPPIFANLVLLASALGFGGLLRRLFPESFSSIDRVALSFLGGIGILGTILFCVGQFWFSRSAILLVLVLGVLFGFRSFARTVRECRTIFRTVSGAGLPVIVVIGVLLVTAIGGLAEPTGDMNHDAIAYHYLGPKVWLRDALIRPVPDEAQTSFPAVVETEFAALMSLGGQRAPQFFAVFGLLSILLMAASLAMRLGLGSQGAWWTAALIISMPAVYRGAFGGFIDVLYAGFVLAAARIAFDAGRAGDYVLVGLFCGLASGTKYTGLIAWALLLLCLFLIAVGVRRCRLWAVLKSLGIVCGAAIAVAFPFYARNWIFLGTPIYPPPPILYKFFQVRYLPVEAILQYHAYILKRGAGLGRGLGAYFLLPFNLTFHTSNFHGAGGIGLAPLALAPIGLIASRNEWLPKALALLVLLLTTAWFFTQQESRFLIPVYVLLAVFAVLGWQYVARVGSKYARGLSAVVVTISILYGLYMIVPESLVDSHAAVSPTFEDKRRHEEIPYLESFDYINAEPFVSKVLILDPYVAAYYSDKAYVKPLGRWGEQTLPDATNLQAVLSQAHNLHVSHILDVLPEAGPLKLPENPQGLTLVFQGQNQRVYRVD
jgi:hypothetical protein